MNRRAAFVLLAALVTGLGTPVVAQQLRPLTHDDYDDWKSLSGSTWSDDGRWVAYSIRPQWGDEVLVARSTENDTEWRFDLGKSPRFSYDGSRLFFTVGESTVEKRAERLAELREKGSVKPNRGGGSRGFSFRFGGPSRTSPRAYRSGGKGGLGIMDLATGEVEVIEKVLGYHLPEHHDLLIYHRDKAEEKDKKEKSGDDEKGEKTEKAEKTETGPSGERGSRRERGEKSKKPERPDGTTLVIRELASGDETEIPWVVGYGLTTKGSWLYYHTSTKEPVDDVDYGLFGWRLGSDDRVEWVDGVGDFTGFTSDESETGLAFASDVDDRESEKPKYSIYLSRLDDTPAYRIAWAGAPGLPQERILSKSGLGFSKDGRVVTFGIVRPDEDLPKILPEEKVVLDLWHFRDGLIQPMQEKQKARLDNPSWTCAYHREADRRVVLGDAVIPSMSLITPDGSRALATDGTQYEERVSWDGRYIDAYVVNTVDGSRTRIVAGLRGSVRASPLGKYVTYYADGHWFCVDVATNETKNLTENLAVRFDRIDDDHPSPAPAHGSTGWTDGDAEFVINDEFDLWRVSPTTGDAVCITDGFGRAENIRLRYTSLDSTLEHLPEELTLTGQHQATMAEGVFRDALTEVRAPARLMWADKSIGSLAKAKSADRYFFTLQTFADYPDLYTTDDSFADPRRLSNANPQQKQISWGQSELWRWTSADGTELKGILVKPDGFDPEKKYPLMVYFYERMSSRLHRYTAPSPGTSPNASYYVSNGYLWFMPDVHYDVGYPGESAVKCVVSGVQSLVNAGFVAEDSIGAAGHSWGGYQTAYLVTKTDIFRCVESGAPVSNMFSAYGGIRWGSGMSRQFQYEQTQSRIGGTPWQYPMRFWENSPLFFADKVNTPVLMLHNDQDGAVPWYQGIEYFMALRRLGKEAYMFNYVGEEHGLRQRQNQVDWTRRMQEYFDHHLRGTQPPSWMLEGVAYVDREREKLPFVRSLIEAESPAAPVAAAPATEPSSPATTTAPESPADPVAPETGEKTRPKKKATRTIL